RRLPPRLPYGAPSRTVGTALLRPLPSPSVATATRVTTKTTADAATPFHTTAAAAAFFGRGRRGRRGGPREKGKKKKKKQWRGPPPDPKMVVLRKTRHYRAPPPLRMGRNRALRHWTIHRAWQLHQRAERDRAELALGRAQAAMAAACEELRHTEGPGS